MPPVKHQKQHMASHRRPHGPVHPLLAQLPLPGPERPQLPLHGLERHQLPLRGQELPPLPLLALHGLVHPQLFLVPLLLLRGLGHPQLAQLPPRGPVLLQVVQT